MKELNYNIRSWIAQNLLLGAEPEGMKSVLLNSGYPQDLVDKEISDATHHPYINGVQKVKDKLDRRESLLRTLDYLKRQNKDNLKIERTALPSFREFLYKYYYENKPGLFSNAIPNWEARNWTPRKLEQKVGRDVQVQVQVGRESDPNYEQNSHQHRKEMQFGDFIDLVEDTESSNDFYMTANNLTLMSNPAFKCVIDDTGNIGDGWLHPDRIGKETHLWIGPKGTITPLHHDLTNNIFIQIYGKKLFRMIPSIQAPYVHNNNHVFSDVDVLNPDLKQCPDYKNVTPIEVEVGPGDLLFIPIGWWHHVVSLTKNISLSFTNVNLSFNGFINFPSGNNKRY